MEGVEVNFWQGRRVFITGHSGFKGGWLSLLLRHLGAVVKGYALEPEIEQSIFHAAQLDSQIESVFADINDLDRLKAEIRGFAPEIIFHLAAQPLVRCAYQDPVGTYRTNVMGTVHLLEAMRGCSSLRAAVVVTTDKCYENREWSWPYREIDSLGGYDPYSSSKACAELVVSAWRNSFFAPSEYHRHGVALASARAGNVIGGGDWSSDRLIPDLVRAFGAGQTASIRNPLATRPWQHVLEALRGYLMLGEKLITAGTAFGEAWNFGPDSCDNQPVEWIAEEVARLWGDRASWQLAAGEHPHESQLLGLDCAKASYKLHWRPMLGIEGALRMTAEWYKRFLTGESALQLCQEQIAEYIERTAPLAPSGN